MSSSATNLPANVHVSTHPCLRAKLSQLRSSHTDARETRTLVHEIGLIVACEALAQGLSVARAQHTDTSPIGYEFTPETIAPAHVSIMPILRSGLAMVDAVQTLLPYSVPVHHMGLFREKTTMTAIEYYNNLPYHSKDPGPSELVVLVDPVIATGATACAAIDTLREWGVGQIVMVAVIASRQGLERAAAHWEGVEIWVGGMDEEVDGNGMIKPGLGDIGDRLFLTIGK